MMYDLLKPPNRSREHIHAVTKTELRRNQRIFDEKQEITVVGAAVSHCDGIYIAC